jgi:hypothetical protein
MKASGRANYDYVVLQATDNSIPFYESMGFVRIGAVTEDEEKQKKHGDDSSDVGAELLEKASPEKPNAISLPDHIVTSEITAFHISKAGTTLSDVAKRLRVDVWDLVFLNMVQYPELAPGSRLLEGTVLHVPNHSITEPATCGPTRTTPLNEAKAPQFYFAKENDTPRTISKQFGVGCWDLVEANKARLPGLMSSSRLKEGTKIKISHLQVPDAVSKPYAHWSFPDDKFEEGEPSYMMALKLHRRRGNAARERPVQLAFAIPVSVFEPTNLLMPPSPAPLKPSVPPRSLKTVASSKKRKREVRPDAPDPPKKPLGPYLLFFTEQRELQRSELHAMKMGEASKFLSAQWRELSEASKSKYIKISEKAGVEYQKEKARYEIKLEAFLAENLPDEELAQVNPETPEAKDLKYELYNKVVKLKPEAITEGSEYKYW